MASKRTSSPFPAASKGEKSTEQPEAVAEKFVPPPRPSGLRSNLLIMYALLAAAVLASSLIGEGMLDPVPEGKFRDKDGSLIDITDFDAAKLGPYPKCHPHFEEHQVEGADAKLKWVKNSAAPKAGPFPIGHPKNPEWIAKSDAEMNEENEENMVTRAGLQPILHLLLLATLSVLIGCKHSVWLFTETSEDRHALQAEDVAWFAVIGSCMPFWLFAVYKYLGIDWTTSLNSLSTDWVRSLMTCAAVVMCIFGVGTNFYHIFALVRNKAIKPLFTIPYTEEKIMLVELFGWLVGATMAGFYVFSKNWIINNVFVVSLCVASIKMINLSNHETGAIMLVSLFFRDISLVLGSTFVPFLFGSMELEAPIQLMFPRSLQGCGIVHYHMLRLCDIVVPAFFLSFLAKWDAMRMGEQKSASFVYLNTTMIAYVLSFVTSVSITLFFDAAQPALLYIIPFVLITSLAVALMRGECWELLSFTIPDEAAEEQANTAGEKAAQEEHLRGLL